MQTCDQQLEILKQDYLGMQYKVKYKKTFTWKSFCPPYQPFIKYKFRFMGGPL